MRISLLSHILLTVALIATHAVAQSISVEVTVTGQANIWLSGTAPGTKAGACIDGIADLAPGQSPVQVIGIPIKPDGRLAFAASGEVSNSPLTGAPPAPPDGLWNYIIVNHNGAENGIANLIAPMNSLIGVFLGNGEPGGTPSPNTLEFSNPPSREFPTLVPALKQPFFIGNGTDSDGIGQFVIVPKAATRLFLGTMDGCGYWNNEGLFHVRVTTADPPVLTPSRVAEGVISLEAEDAALVSPMEALRDYSASAQASIQSSQVQAGEAQFTVSLPEAGEYRIWCHVLGATSGSDSFFVSVDEGPEDIYDIAEGTWSDEWQWSLVNGRAGTGVPLTLSPRIFSLTAGVHTLRFRGRELGGRLDRISITARPEFVPVQHLIEIAAPGDTVTVPAGLFYDTLVIDKDIILVGSGPTNTVIDSDLLGMSVIVRTNHSVMLRGITFRGTRTRRRPESIEGPRGIIFTRGPLTLVDCQVLGRGAIFGPALNCGDELILEHCEISGNGNDWDKGGGVRCGSLQMSHCVVADNFSDGAGSGIFCSGPATISDSVIRNNSGGVDGGTIFLQSSSNRSAIIRCDIHSNGGRSAPCGISSFGSLDLRDSLVRNNRAENDAGFVNYGTAAVRNCTFTSNRSFQDRAESVSCIQNFGDMSLDHLTIVSNSARLNHQRFASGGAGLLNGGTMRIKNSLIAWNVVIADWPENLPPCQEISGYPAKGDHNLIQNPGPCAATGDPNGDLYGLDPLIGPLADNGGPTLTHALLPGSPAINAGVESDVTTDQRGLPRSKPDIGAYEVLDRPIPILLPLPTAHASTFEAVLVGDPGTTYLLQHKNRLDDTEWQDSSQVVTTDGGGFVNVSVAIQPGSSRSFFRVIQH